MTITGPWIVPLLGAGSEVKILAVSNTLYDYTQAEGTILLAADEKLKGGKCAQRKGKIFHVSPAILFLVEREEGDDRDKLLKRIEVITVR